MSRKPKRHFTNKPTIKEDEMSESQVGRRIRSLPYIGLYIEC